jgi:hypothetical protein
MVKQFQFEKFVPRKRGKSADAETLLHAVVIAARDNATRYDIRDLLKCYPRIQNKINPYLVLFDEIYRLRQQCDAHEKTILELAKLTEKTL